jgi:hypothetical protein
VSDAVDETRRAEFFRKGGAARGLLRSKRWLLLRRWAHLEREERRLVKELLALNRRLAKAYLLKEQLARLWDYTYEGAARRFLTTWLRALRWQRLPAFRRVAQLLLRHRDGILAYCHEKVPFGKVEAINGNIRPCCGGAVATGITSTSCSSPEGHGRAAPVTASRMNAGPGTDSGEDRNNHSHYRVVYRVRRDVAEVLTVFHGNRSFPLG